MGFLDKLLGRTKEETSDLTTDVKTGAEDMGQEAEEMGQKAEEMGKSGAERTEGMAEDAKTEVEEHIPGRDTP
jgi:hypothetical protein